MRCGECSGSGACDPCDGYGTYPDSFPNAGTGPNARSATQPGRCPECGGTGETDSTSNEQQRRGAAAGMRA